MSKLPEQVKIYSSSPSDMSPPVDDKSFCVDFVLAADYEALQSERDQLAAENVAQREQAEEIYAAGYNHGHLNTVDGIAYAACVKDDFYGLALQVMAEAETPATDRFLAEQRAVGVDMLAEHLSGMRISASETSVREFAARLRNEVKV